MHHKSMEEVLVLESGLGLRQHSQRRGVDGAIIRVAESTMRS